MKTIGKFILAAISMATAVSCAKENPFESNPDEGLRFITATMSTVAQKTTLEGVTPIWAVGDKLLLLNTIGSQEIEVIEGSGKPEVGKAYVNGNTLTIATDLDGALYGVYPSTATTAKSVTTSSLPIIIPGVQDGSFASANICVAKASGNTLPFKNATSVLKFTQNTAAVNNFFLLASAGITGNIEVSCDEPVSVTTPANKGVNVVCGTGKKDIYVAVAPGTITNIVAMTDSKYQTRTFGDGGVTVTVNDLCTVCNFDEGWSFSNNLYEEIGGIKWATINIGATKPEEGGYYFSWGNTDGHWLNGVSDGYGFSQADYDATKVSTFETDLTAEYDAACINWGGKWRMPTRSEIDNLMAVAKSKSNATWDNDIKTVTIKNSDDDHQIVVYAGGYIVDSAAKNARQYVRLLASTTGELAEGETIPSTGWRFSAEYSSSKKTLSFNTKAGGRLNGLNVRPVYDSSATE